MCHLEVEILLKAALKMSSSLGAKYSSAGLCLKEQQQKWGGQQFSE